MSEVIVVGGNHHNTLGVIRSLGRAGISSYVILTSGISDSFVLKSKYIKKHWTFSGCDKVVDFLLSNLVFEKKAVLIGCHDVISSIFDINKDILSKFFYVPSSKVAGRITELAEKFQMAQLADRVGFNVPLTLLITGINDTNLTDVVYPCITKPTASKDGSKSDIQVLSSEKQLKLFLSERSGHSFVVQQFIEKDYEFQFIGCSINGGEDVIIPGVSELLRPSKSSNTGFLKYRNLKEDEEDALLRTKEFIKATAYSGLFSVEFIKDKNGKIYFMEMNFRNDGNSICVTNSGVNLPYIWYLSCLGEDWKKALKNIHTEYVMPEFQELALWYSYGIDTKTMIGDFRRATSYMDYDKDDLKPTNGKINFYKELIVLSLKRMAKYLSGGKH